MGLSQRQAGGKFTIQEASTLIDQLLNTDISPDGSTTDIEVSAADEKIRATQAVTLRGIPADLLSDELTRRGWSVRAPS